MRLQTLAPVHKERIVFPSAPEDNPLVRTRCNQKLAQLRPKSLGLSWGMFMSRDHALESFGRVSISLWRSRRSIQTW